MTALKLSADQRRALGLLAEAESRGIPEPILVDEHGFAIDALAELVSAGYASVAPGKMRAGGRMIEVARVIATDVGRRVVAH
jgi:hypothetical protein